MEAMCLTWESNSNINFPLELDTEKNKVIPKVNRTFRRGLGDSKWKGDAIF